ncbi:MAG TPA: diguanylate cyclase [Candidatus Saccharimonadales bacterium]|nr:diguanylate cyclase [Candidatus Saccharimonadales bacterium]
MVFDRNQALVGVEREMVVAEFVDQAHAAGIEYGYDPEKLERFMAVRGNIAEIAISAYGVTDVEEITPELIKEIAIFGSPELQEKIDKDEAEKRRYKRLAMIDELTGLGSRHAFKEALATAEADPNVAIIKLDANDFGKINKELGDDEGDEALKGIGRHIRNTAEEYGYGERTFRLEAESEDEEQEQDSTFRVGGDEFIVLAPTDIADELLERIISTYGDEGSMQYGSTTVSLTGATGSTLEEVNLALRDAKAEHRLSRPQ